MLETFYSVALVVVAIPLVRQIYLVKDPAKKYKPRITQNTLFYYLLILSSFALPYFCFGVVTISNVLCTYLVLFFLHEAQWYLFHTQLVKDELESTNDFYSWCNHLNDGITRESAVVEDGHDFSEGIFNGDFTLSNRQAMQNKYDLYYEYLKLKPGMKVLDIGCGNGHWGHYLKQKAIEVTGIVICEDNYNECVKKGIKTILGDARIVMKNIKERFDAVTAIGPVEHFSSVSQPVPERIRILKEYFQDVVNLIDPKSSSRMYLNSIITMNQHWSKFRSLEFVIHFYLIASVFGSGHYPYEEEIEGVYSTDRSKIMVKRDYTEDYRYMFVKDEKVFDHFKWRFNTSKKIFFLLKSILSDFYWPHRLLFGIAKSWAWQFGGSQKEPMPHNKDTPIRAYIYTVEIDSKRP